jgi:TPR repeat protein
MYKRGWGVEADWNEAVRHYIKGAEDGDPHAMYYYGRLLRDGRHGVEKNWRTAFKFLMLAARQKELKAYPAVGTMLRKGWGVRKNLALSAEWFRHAAKRKLPRGIFRLAGLYMHGRGVERNVDEAVRLYREAADLDDASACYKLGKTYCRVIRGKRDIGVKQDIDEARRLLAKADQLGHSRASIVLQSLSP